MLFTLLLPLFPVAGPTVADAPPVVVKCTPLAGSDDVDAATVTEVRVTFSKAMTDKSWSWATATDFGEELKPTGPVKFDKDGKTFVVPVKLKPGTTYAVWVNSDQFTNFRDAKGNAALPYLVVFQTKK
jgi:hypothetical protein